MAGHQHYLTIQVWSSFMMITSWISIEYGYSTAFCLKSDWISGLGYKDIFYYL